MWLSVVKVSMLVHRELEVCSFHKCHAFARFTHDWNIFFFLFKYICLLSTYADQTYVYIFFLLIMFSFVCLLSVDDQQVGFYCADSCCTDSCNDSHQYLFLLASETRHCLKATFKCDAVFWKKKERGGGGLGRGSDVMLLEASACKYCIISKSCLENMELTPLGH